MSRARERMAEENSERREDEGDGDAASSPGWRAATVRRKRALRASPARLCRALPRGPLDQDLLRRIPRAWRRAGDIRPREARWRPGWSSARSRAIDGARRPGPTGAAGRSRFRRGDPAADPGRISDHQRLGGVFSVMSAEEREVILLGYFEGLSSTEIAERIGKPVGTVKSRTRSALEKLRGALAREAREP